MRTPHTPAEILDWRGTVSGELEFPGQRGFIYGEIVGWGKCVPPATLTNDDLATFLNTSDEWIFARTGIRERRISHVSVTRLAATAGQRALACAGVVPEAVDLVVLGTCTGDEQVPNTCSGVARLLGATRAAVVDLNSACTSSMYALSFASALVRTGAIRTALVIGAEALSVYMDWNDRGPAILFGDGAGAIVIRAAKTRTGVLADTLGSTVAAQDLLRIRGLGGAYANAGRLLGTTQWDFDGPGIFKHAVTGMAQAIDSLIAKYDIQLDTIDLIVPHQANLRIVEAVSKKLAVPIERFFVNIEKYGNMSSASIPVALAEAVEYQRLQPGATLLLVSFGGGLTWTAHLVQWGERITPLESTTVDLPPCTQSGLDIVCGLRAAKTDPLPATFAAPNLDVCLGW